MVSDATTFTLAFAAVFGALAYGLWRFELRLGDLQKHVDMLATRDKNGDGDQDA